MCIIGECNTKLTKTEFDECFRGNSHGAGFAWRGEDGLNHYKKGFMTKEVAWDAYQDVPIPHVAHFRLASAGGVCPELTHPFIVKRDSPIPLEWSGPEALVFHNGTITDWKTMLFSVVLNTGMPEGAMSDTRFVAMAMSLPIGEDVMCFFTSSKFAILGGDGKIYRIGDWQQNEDNWYSNAGYKSYSRSYTYSESYGYGGYGGYGSTPRPWYGDDETLPIAQQFCTNCKYHIPCTSWVNKTLGKCKRLTSTDKGPVELKNYTRCTSWEMRRGPGRPRKKKDKDKDKKDSAEFALVPVETSHPARVDHPWEKDKNCTWCVNWLGQMMCAIMKEKMHNMLACKSFERRSLADHPVGSAVVIGEDKDGNIKTFIEDRRAL